MEAGEPSTLKRSLLAPFGEQLFVEHSGWRSLDEILQDSGGGSYGLSGPRGAGKTWMMDRALRDADDRGGLGVWFPSPSEYEPIAFLAALSDVVAARYEMYYDRRTGRATKAARQRFILTVGIGAVVSYASLVLIVTGFATGRSGVVFIERFNFGGFLALLAAIIGVGLAFYGARRFTRDKEGLGRLRREAEDLRRQVRYTMSATETAEAGFSGSTGGIGASLKRARERQLVERPATLSSLIHNFRAFVEAVAKAVDGPLVIAIDELDKMSDAERVGQLFRDIKGIFEIPGTFFLVSLSDEAARALDLGAVRTRNEFNSSFYTVIAVRSLMPADCLAVLRRRDPHFDELSGLAIGVVTGGVSREVIRTAELVRIRSGDAPSIEIVARITVEEELLAFSEQVLLTTDEPAGLDAVDDRARVQAFEAISDISSVLGRDEETVFGAVRRGWTVNDHSPAWQDGLAEEWRRVLVRASLCGLLAARPKLLRDQEVARELQQIVNVNASSAAVARWQVDAWRDSHPAPSFPPESEGTASGDVRVGS